MNEFVFRSDDTKCRKSIISTVYTHSHSEDEKQTRKIPKQN